MTLASRITRVPRPFEPEQAADVEAAFAGAPPEAVELLGGTAGSSPFLRGLIAAHGDWLREAIEQEPETALGSIMDDVRALEPTALKTGLRLAKARLAVLVALADLGGVWPLEQVTAALTDFADLAVDRALKALIAAEIDRGRLPGMGEDDKATGGGMCVLAMGKMGAHELNYSSDIDLICLFDETRFDPADFAEARAIFVRATRRMASLLSEKTAEGYVFRTDLRLRPDPSVTPVCLSMEAAERYYEGVGRTWERAAYIKARPCAGDIEAGARFLERLRPFIWRKHLDFAAIQDAHDMRLRIRAHKGLHGPLTLEGHDMKLGAGGIREIEFFTQTRQIIAGGRDPYLRVRGTVEGLARLAEREWIPQDVARDLTDDYRAHREVEHRLQMINDAQTHALPKTEEGFARLAALSARDEAEMRADIARRLQRVANLTEGFFQPRSGPAAPSSLEETQAETIAHWRSYPALRSQRAVAIFERLKPEILHRLEKAAEPERALANFDAFLSRLPAGVQLFSLFEANPQLVDLIADIAATAPGLSAYLGNNAGVLDAVIGGDFFAPWPDTEALVADLETRLREATDYEASLDQARAWAKEWRFRVGVHHLRGLIDANEAGAQYAALADAVLRAVWPAVVAEFSRRHGPPPGRGAAIVGMGSLGAERLTSASDLDLIVIYDAAGQDESTGHKRLPSPLYYARLTQALVTALSAPTAQGKLYDVDMRLRPSGRKGPVATSLESFCTYQRTEAWTWEHLALTRARPVAGDTVLCQEVETFRRALLAEPRDKGKVLADVAEMRQRIAEAKAPGGEWEAKLGPGRLQDVELMAQTAALLAGDPARKVPLQLEAGRKSGLLAEADVAVLARAYALMWQLQSAARLLTGSALDMEMIGQGGQEFVLRETGAASVQELARETEQVANKAAQTIDRLLAIPPTAAAQQAMRNGNAP